MCINSNLESARLIKHITSAQPHINMKRILIFICCFVFSLLSLQVAQATSHRPNILLVFADDVGVGDIRTYNNKQSNPDGALPPELPHLEKLAASGMIFTDANTPAGLCAPNRYSILTGNYPWRGRRAGGSWHFNAGSQFLAGQQSLGDVLQSVGYRTAMFGKVHLGALVWPKHPQPKGVTNPEQVTNYDMGDPSTGNGKKKKIFDYMAADFSRQLVDGLNQHGFDYTFLTYGGIQDSPYMYFENDTLVGTQNPSQDPSEDLVFWKGGKYKNENGISNIQGWESGYGMPYWKTNEVGPTLTQKALSFIESHYEQNQREGTKKPFFMHYCSQAVHVPHTPPKQMLGVPIAGQTGDSVHTDMLYELDVTLGMILDDLKQRGELENTLVIFTSDNGGLNPKVQKSRHNSNEGVRGYKAQIWEGGHRVPLFISWGKADAWKIPAGIRTDHMVSIKDIFATLSDLVGAEKEPAQGLDSASFIDLLKSRNPDALPAPRAAMTFKGGGDQKGGKYDAIREGKWKLITNHGSPVHLYNLKNDPTESSDLIDHPEHTQRINEMHKMLKAINGCQGTDKRST